VRPERASSAETVRVHGLRDADLAGAAGRDDALEPLLDALEGRVLVAHAAQVERTFLAPVLARAGRRPIRRAIDTAELWARVSGGVAGDGGRVVALEAVAEALGLPVHAPHTAEGDALTTAQVFLALAARLDAARPQTVRSLAGKHARATRGIRQRLA
jgi:DNA polymerase-3 subunit epsilon